MAKLIPSKISAGVERIVLSDAIINSIGKRNRAKTKVFTPTQIASYLNAFLIVL